MWIRNAENWQWEYLSPAFDTIYGISRLDALRGDNFRSWLDLILPEDRERALSQYERVRAGERVNFEYRITRPQDGAVRWMRNTDFPMRDAQGKVVRVGGVGSDITALKEAEEHQRLLLSELQHRVRNTLSVIRSIARRTARSSTSVEDYAMNLESRIDAFARVQGAVTRDPHAGVDLAMLVAEELRAASAREGESIRVTGPPFRVRARAAETLALAIHELATNAIKHGALSTAPGGRIDISWSETAHAQLAFAWRESDGPAPGPEPRRHGLGSEILERTIPYELGGETALEFRADGVNFRMLLPLERIRIG